MFNEKILAKIFVLTRVSSVENFFNRENSRHNIYFVVYFLVTYSLSWGELPSVLCCARILVYLLALNTKLTCGGLLK